MTRVFRYGVYGIGRIGRVHANIVREQGHQIVALGDERQDAIAAAQDEIDAPDAITFHDPAQMARDLAGVIDAVIIASHTGNHAKDALPFVKAGIPVYLEKPLTEDLREGFDFVEIIGPDRRQIQIGLQRRFDPALLYTRDLIRSGVAGEIREIRCVLRDQFPPAPTYRSGGLILDMGIHVADEAIFLLDEFPSAVWASLHHSRAYQSPIDEGGDTAFVTFTTPSGVLGRLDLSRTHSSGYNNETYIIGVNGVIHTGRFAGYPGPIPVEVWRPDGTRHPDSRIFEMTRPKGRYPEFLPRFDAAYRNAHQKFRDAMEGGADFAVTQHEALDAQVFVEAAYRSGQRGGVRYPLERDGDLPQYRASCIANGLLNGD